MDHLNKEQPSTGTGSGKQGNAVNVSQSSNLAASITSITSVEMSEGRVAAESHGKELRRNLGFWGAFGFVVAVLFGSGIFISPGLVASQTENMGMAIVAWILAGIPCLLGALCFCELTCMYGKTGGVYLYMYEAYGDFGGFACIWARTLIVDSVGMAAISLSVGHYLFEPFCDIESKSGVWLVKMVAVLAMLISAVINCVSTSFVGKSQVWFAIIQVLSISFIVVLGVWQVAIGNTSNFVTMFDNSSKFEIGSFGIALYNGLWGYDGWDMIAQIAEELENMERNLLLSIVTAIPFVMFCYIIINLALMSVLTREQMAASSTVATTFVANILGDKVAFVIPFAVSLSILAGLTGISFLSTRIMVSAGREGHLPCFLSYIHKDRRTPIPAIALCYAHVVFWVIQPAFDIQALLAIYSLAIWVQSFLSIASLILMRIRKPNMERPYKVWMINPIFASIIALFLVVIPFVSKPVESLICVAVYLSALPVYYVCIKKYGSLPSVVHTVVNKLNKFLERRFNLVPCIYVGEENTTDSVNNATTPVETQKKL